MELIRKGSTAKLSISFEEYDGTPVADGTVHVDMRKRTNDGQDKYWYNGSVWQSGYTTFTPFTYFGYGYHDWDFNTSGLIDSNNEEVQLFIRAWLVGATTSPTIPSGKINLTIGGLADEIVKARLGKLGSSWIDADNFQEVFFDDDGNELLRLNLFDINGNPAHTGIYRKTIV